MKKHIANIVTLSRVVGSVVLFCCNTISSLFLTVYIFCGFTDLIDGPIARKTNSSSILGAILDTIGDVLTYLALTKILIMQQLIPLWILAWFLCAGVILIACAFISKRRFDKLYLPHTYLGKIFGGSIFVLPVTMQFMNIEIWLSVICSIASAHAVELAYIQSKNKTAKDFVATIFHIEK